MQESSRDAARWILCVASVQRISLNDMTPMQTHRWNYSRMALAACSAVLVLAGLLLPTDWYDALPHLQTRIPIAGISLLKGSLIFDGLVVFWLAHRCRFPSTAPSPAPARLVDSVNAWDISGRTAMLGLLLTTMLAMFLRIFGITSDLWLDEIAIIVDYRDVSPLGVLLTYIKPNNHLLNTELVKLMTSLAGEQEWAVRLPAVFFGVATIPVMYWVARPAAGRLASLCAALLLAVSYHHIFFSQNSRGYSSYLLFSLLATGCLVRGLDRDRPRDWLGYVASMLFNLASLLHAGFVLAGHVVIGAAAILKRKHSGETSFPLIRRLATVFGVIGLLGLQLYLPVSLQAYSVLDQVYRKPSAGMPITSHAFATDFAKGLTEGLGSGLLIAAVPAVAIAGFGAIVLFRKKWTLAGAFVVPLGLLAVLVAFFSLAASPRFFLLGLPLAILAVVLGVSSLATRICNGRNRSPSSAMAAALTASALTLMAIASAASLPTYYQTPKQSYRAALEYIRTENHPSDLIVLIQNAEQGFRFYGEQQGLRDGRDFVAIRTLSDFNEVRARGRTLVIVTTLERGLRLEEPELLAQIEQGWRPVKVLPATIHEGEIRIWRANR